MQSWANSATMEAAELLGEWHPLVEQLGSSEGLMPLGQASAALDLPAVSHRLSLLNFLETYKSRVLIPHELPAILRAFLHASRQETRELIAFDQALAAEADLADFARPSQRVGQFQLKRLRPLRDHRPLQRYLHAVETDQAFGWHTLVYGLSLSIYSLPVRQGLLFYERQTLRGFLFAAARALRLSARDCRLILDELCADLPGHLDSLVAARPWPASSSRS